MLFTSLHYDNWKRVAGRGGEQCASSAADHSLDGNRTCDPWAFLSSHQGDISPTFSLSDFADSGSCETFPIQTFVLELGVEVATQWP